MGLLGSIFQSNSNIVNLNSESFGKQAKEDKDAVLLDVRTRAEHADGHIPNSILIDIMSPGFSSEIDKLDRNKSYYVYCRSGNRSYQAGKIMEKMGFEKIYNLERGMNGWSGEVE